MDTNLVMGGCGLTHETIHGITDDSGNYSCSSPISDNKCAMKQQSNFETIFRQKEESLFLALQDLHKLQNETERLSKSEQWYKSELNTQKATRLEILERLYTQERMYIKENQRLQQECLRLYKKCTDLESNLELKSAKITSHELCPVLTTETEGGVGFKIQQQQSIIADQNQLIEVLRLQKIKLLSEIEQLSVEHNEKLLELQCILANMELENKRVTGKCKKLIDEKSNLEERVKLNAINMQDMFKEKCKLQKIVNDLNETILAQEKLLVLKEQQLMDFKQQVNSKLINEQNIDEMRRLNITYHQEISAKTHEINALKLSLQHMQNKFIYMAELETKNELQQRTIGHLNSILEAQNLENENLKTIDKDKTQQIVELGQCLECLRKEKENVQIDLCEAQSKYKCLEEKLISLHEQYANMCAFCENTKLQLELQLQVGESNKRAIQSDDDTRELKLMQQYLDENVVRMSVLSATINQFESKLKDKNEEICKLHNKLHHAEMKLKRTQENHNLIESTFNAENINLDKNMCQLDNALVKSSNINLATRTNEKGIQTENEEIIETIRPEFIEDKLVVTENIDRKAKTVSLLNNFLRQQNEKVHQIDSSYNDWEEVLKVLNNTQKFEENMRIQLQHKTAELEELNALFAAQNEELHYLQELSYLSECKRDQKFKNMIKSFQNHIKLLEENCEKRIIETEALKEENKKLQGDLQLVVDQKKQLENLQAKLDELLEERKSTSAKLMELRYELTMLKLNGSEVSKTENMSKPDDCFRVLTKVLEAECGRKINRSDLPTIIKNIKKLSKIAKETKKMEDINLLKSHLQNVHAKYEQDQERIKYFEQKPEAEQTNSTISDLRKTTGIEEESAHEVANLIDDYKKLIQDSAFNTGRLRTGAILGLIERSNNCVPNLNKLETCVNEFHDEVQHLSNILLSMDTETHLKKDNIPNLMEELRLVKDVF